MNVHTLEFANTSYTTISSQQRTQSGEILLTYVVDQSAVELRPELLQIDLKVLSMSANHREMHIIYIYTYVPLKQ